MQTTRDPSGMRRPLSKSRWILLISCCVILLAVGIGAALLIRYWPFNQADIVETLQETVPGTKVTVAQFHSTYFLHPGCIAEGVVFIREASPSGSPPLVTVQKLLIQAQYADLFLRPGYVSRIVIGGLHIQVPPRGSSVASQSSSSPADTSSRQTVVGEISADDALLEVGRRDDSPLRFEIHGIQLNSAGVDKVMSYRVQLRNALPPGEIRSTGKIGPWNAHDPGQIPVSGSYKFDQADLTVFSGIGGTLSSTGKFDGRLGQIEVKGSTDTPAFAVKTSGHPFPLKSSFQAQVDGTNGDVKLTRVDVLLQDTPIEVAGGIVGKPSIPGKTTTLDLIANRGSVQDVLRPFVKAPVPPMSGPLNFRARVVLFPGDRPFLKRVSLVGDFAIAPGRFTKAETQQNVNRLSENSRGMKNNNGDPPLVESNLKGHVMLSEGVAKFSSLSFDVPGASAQMKGTFDVSSEKVDFHGTLKTDAELSKETHGIKSELLKPLDPIFKRKHHGAVVPVEMTGTYSNPHFGIEVLPR
jgi:hypothetical protein